jgi:choline dehydrogenase-like flavoprotein
MLLDADDIEHGTARECFVCVAGAGAAGITLARELSRRGLKVCLLEGGGLEFDEPSQSLYEGVVEPPLPPDYLLLSRLRYFGGTTNHWQGFLRPLEPWDFETRSWIPHSGWPITRQDLDPYFLRAAAVLEIPDRLPEDRHLGSPDERLFLGCFHRRPLRFGPRYLSELQADGRIELVLHATAIHLGLAPSGRTVERLEVATPRGRSWNVRARHYVLALGAIENARLLLLSDDVVAHGVGNERDLVGRFFSDHAVFRKVAKLGSRATQSPLHERPEGADHQTCFVTLAGQEAHGIGGCAIGVDLLPQDASPSPGLAKLRTPALDAVMEELGAPTLQVPEVLPALHVRTFDVRPEIAPDPESRVTLDEELDAHGKRRVRLRLRQGPLDLRTAARSLELFATALGRLGLGRVWIDSQAVEERIRPGAHHSGTTRMHDDPSRGVVDRHCRVHGVANLFLAGGSVFPTAGAVNPTLTIVALALRLCDHLADLR